MQPPGMPEKVFRDGEGGGIDFANEGVGELEVGHRVPVHAVFKVFVVVIEGGVTVMVVKHGGDAIEAEAVEAEVLEPVGEVGEEEVAGGGVAVVEEKRVPLLVFASGAAVEEVASLAVELADAFGEVLDGVGVDEVQDNRDT